MFYAGVVLLVIGMLTSLAARAIADDSTWPSGHWVTSESAAFGATPSTRRRPSLRPATSAGALR